MRSPAGSECRCESDVRILMSNKHSPNANRLMPVACAVYKVLKCADVRVQKLGEKDAGCGKLWGKVGIGVMCWQVRVPDYTEHVSLIAAKTRDIDFNLMQNGINLIANLDCKSCFHFGETKKNDLESRTINNLW